GHQRKIIKKRKDRKEGDAAKLLGEERVLPSLASSDADLQQRGTSTLSGEWRRRPSWRTKATQLGEAATKARNATPPALMEVRR
ncbi:hypothetical protein PIB30_113801, partial [Stylosanthes scabra]|nr:hypothetical protein [Stylosanthes scabra]